MSILQKFYEGKVRPMTQPDVGKQIRECRKTVGLTQVELASHVNHHVSTIQKYEAGVQNPPPMALLHLAREFAKPDDFFFIYCREG